MKKRFNIFLYYLLFLCILTMFPHSLGARNISQPSGGPLTNDELRQAASTIGNPESELYDEEKYCEVLRKAINSPLIDEGDRIRAGFRLEIAAKNRPGNTASDFAFETREGETARLHNVKSEKPILLLFYDPDCNHCIQTIDALRESDIASVAEVVAIYAEEDRKIWEEANSTLPDNWTVGFALDPIQDDETYVFLTSPILYLLTPDKTVLLKDTTLSAVADALGITIKNTLSDSK